jgi:hypothetical protein
LIKFGIFRIEICVSGYNICARVYIIAYALERGTRVRRWMRHCAESRKVAGSIPYGAIGVFHGTVALRSTQPLTEMSTRNISWGGKCDRWVRMTTLPTLCVDCLEILEPQPSGTLSAYPSLYRDCFNFLSYSSGNSLRHIFSSL